MKTARKTIDCGDWHLGWGYGGYDKVGKLHILEDNSTFLWEGKSQGRHGRSWNYCAKCKFRIQNGEVVVIESKGSYPIKRELLKSATELAKSHL